MSDEKGVLVTRRCKCKAMPEGAIVSVIAGIISKIHSTETPLALVCPYCNLIAFTVEPSDSLRTLDEAR